MAKLPTARRQVSPLGPIGVVAPTGQLAEARTAAVVGQQADQLNNQLSVIAKQNAQDVGTEKGNSFVFDRDELGRIIPPDAMFDDLGPIPSIESRAAKRQLQIRFEQDVETQARASYRHRLETR